MLREPRAPWPKHVEVLPHVPPTLNGAAAVITFIGHATFLIQTAAGNVLTDPMYSERASPAGVARAASGPPARRALRRSAAHFDRVAQSQSLRPL